LYTEMLYIELSRIHSRKMTGCQAQLEVRISRSLVGGEHITKRTRRDQPSFKIHVGVIRFTKRAQGIYAMEYTSTGYQLESEVYTTTKTMNMQTECIATGEK
jgi:hypothetical protein